ncbi:DegT/DnrJ/EryC1/StrS family aminotransferase [Micromonospora sp. NBS 11-29]|uniref:DegT/DnrJ/EryC1/StrS family aminotransferase n=1 Tax=Micromonospora sp. NBS 11-29 TaxID=1960879 RepID=UPI000B7877EB|nr:aminotransferase class I/II-fold pyridoxal phosphate-dependent enzyme [Micromonospora sp. NBS 11-29]
MSGQIWLSPPDVGPLEESYLLAALRSGWVAPLGPEVDAFEREVARHVGVSHAVALSSGTAGLHLALLALGVGPGQLVVVPSLTFVATANAVVYTGAEPVFVDCDPATGNLDPVLLRQLLADLHREGRTAAAVVPVDLFGSCADYGRILPVCGEYGVPVVEDAAEALGANRSGRAAGSFGRAGVFSFNGNKIITTSGGGMLVSDDADLVARCRYLATQARRPVAHYEHTEVGYNYRLSNLLAAIGRAQLHRLDTMIERRRRLREHYAKLFAAQPGVRLLAEDDHEANYWLTTLVVDRKSAGWHAGALADHLAALQIETRPLWKPMHRQPAYAGARALLTGAADRIFADGLALPSGSAMNESQIGKVLDGIETFLGAR